MKPDMESISFGRYLQAIRLEKKISLEKVSEQTRIGLGNLLLVEQEDHQRLPAEVFVKGFLRAYANAIGADADEAVRRYESRLSVVKQIAESEASEGKPTSRLWWKLMISLFLLMCIIVLSIYGVTYFQAQTAMDRSHVPTPPAAEESSAETRTSPEAKSDAKPANPFPEKLLLEATALENTWLKVIIDDKESTEYSLNSGEHIKLEAVSSFSLLIGNAGGIKITLNDKPVSIPGESGQVVTLHLP